MHITLIAALSSSTSPVEIAFPAENDVFSVNVLLCAHIQVCVVHVCMYVCMYVFMFACIHPCMRVQTYVCAMLSFTGDIFCLKNRNQ